MHSVAHGLDKDSDTANWIISIATLPFSDVFATGSKDGFVRVWKCENQKFTQLFEIPVVILLKIKTYLYFRIN